MAELTDEMITELAGWLFPNSKIIPSRSADSLEAVENAMIERGYFVSIIIYNKNSYNAYFSKPVISNYQCAQATTKAEAMLLAAYKAMKKEAQDGRTS